MDNKRIIPKVWCHDIQLMTEGVGSTNPKEHCKCDDCAYLRLRRDNIYKTGFIFKLLKLFSS